MNFSVTITKTGRSACVRVTGDLDYETADEVVEAASQLLARQVDLIDLHLDFSGLTFLATSAAFSLIHLSRAFNCISTIAPHFSTGCCR